MSCLQIPKQLEPLLTQRARFKVAYGGRGGMKSWAFAGALLTRGILEPIRWACLREVQNSIQDSVHKLLSDLINRLGLQAHYSVLKTSIVGRNGTEFLFKGLSTETSQSIKSLEGCDGAWVEEAQTVSKHSWNILTPTIFRKAGSEIWVSFNPDLDTDETWVRFIENTPPGTILMSVNYSDNLWPTEEMDAERDHMKVTDPASYENVWLGKPRAAALGAIYTYEMRQLAESIPARVARLPYDAMLKVHTVWDIGFNDATAIIFAQKNSSEIRIIDYIEDTHKDVTQYAKLLRDKKYNYGKHWLPWDASEKRFKFTNPKNSPEGMLKTQGIGKVGIVDKVDVEYGIAKARVVFPRTYWDKDKTLRLRECLKRYKRSVPKTTGEATDPVHDEFSHGADAFRYLALACDKFRNEDYVHQPLQIEQVIA